MLCHVVLLFERRENTEVLDKSNFLDSIRQDVCEFHDEDARHLGLSFGVMGSLS